MSTMRAALRRHYGTEEGATATEYVVLLVFIALAIFIGAGILGGGLNDIFKGSCDELANQAASAGVTANC